MYAVYYWVLRKGRHEVSVMYERDCFWFAFYTDGEHLYLRNPPRIDFSEIDVQGGFLT